MGLPQFGMQQDWKGFQSHRLCNKLQIESIMLSFLGWFKISPRYWNLILMEILAIQSCNKITLLVHELG